MNNRELGFADVASFLSLALGYENLMENRQQSVQNDVGAANDAQAKFLLEQISKRFEEQNKVLADIDARLDRLEKAMAQGGR